MSQIVRRVWRPAFRVFGRLRAGNRAVRLLPSFLGASPEGYSRRRGDVRAKTADAATVSNGADSGQAERAGPVGEAGREVSGMGAARARRCWRLDAGYTSPTLPHVMRQGARQDPGKLP